jgi:hypothetical protein
MILPKSGLPHSQPIVAAASTGLTAGFVVVVVFAVVVVGLQSML